MTVLGPRVPRGYDIAVEAGQSAGGCTEPRQGLAVLVAGRSRSRRSDRWLQGLAARRGDPGQSRFYLSEQDPVLAGLQSRVMTWLPAAIRRRADGTPIGAVPAAARYRLIGGHDLDRGRPLMRVHPDDDLAHLLLLPYPDVVNGPGGHRYFELSKPLLSLSLPTAPGPRRPNESHVISAGIRCESDGPGTWTEPGRAPVLGQVNK